MEGLPGLDCRGVGYQTHIGAKAQVSPIFPEDVKKDVRVESDAVDGRTGQVYNALRLIAEHNSELGHFTEGKTVLLGFMRDTEYFGDGILRMETSLRDKRIGHSLGDWPVPH